ncbi:MAG: putative glycoside hydrolase, partial [Bacteroidota bacterium]
MFKIFFFLIFCSAQFLFAQPSEYLSRGTKSYIVNYGAIGGNPFLAKFAAKRFVLIDESSASDIKQIHLNNPSIPILHYKDVVALGESFAEYDSCNKDESAFLHTCEPSGLIVIRSGEVSAYWLKDRRYQDFQGYKIYYSADSNGTFISNNIVYPMNETVVSFPDWAKWFRVSTILKDGTEVNYGFSVKEISFNQFPVIIPKIISETRSKDTVRIYVEVESIGDTEPDSLIISIDENRNNIYDKNEKMKMVKSNGKWIASKIIILTAISNGGYEFIIKAYKSSTAYQYPLYGSYGTNINNRLKNDYYNFYVMDVGNSTWRKAYIQEILKVFSNLGYNGLFEDDTWYKVSPWGVDGAPIFAYSDSTWKNNMFDFLDMIKESIAPRPAYFNGLYAGDAATLLPHADGGMTEGFAHTHWSNHVTGDYWKELCNVGLQCQHQYKKTWLCLGGIHNSDPEARIYVLASYLLVSDSLSIYANANDYQTFAHYPEFDLNLGKPLESANLNINDLKKIYTPNGTEYFQRQFELGTVVVNPNPTKFIIIDNTEGQRCVFVDTNLTVEGGRLFTITAKDTVFPKQARIYLNWNSDGNRLCSPKVHFAKATSELDSESIEKNILVTFEVEISDSSDNIFKSNANLPLYVIAETAITGGPKELKLTNDNTPAYQEKSTYRGFF